MCQIRHRINELNGGYNTIHAQDFSGSEIAVKFGFASVRGLFFVTFPQKINDNIVSYNKAAQLVI